MFERARHLFVALGLAVATAFAPLATTAQAQIPYLSLSSQPKYAAVVVDAKTGEVLYAKRADSPRYPASITKVMTLYLAFEALASGRLKLDDPVMISPRAAAQAPTKLGLAAGQTLTVEEAMSAMATKSANDIAVALAEKLGGSEARFAAMMTLRAQELGMQNTRFVNASGLPDSRQISTARDIAILSRAVMRDYPQYYGLFGTRSFSFRGVSMRNHNGMLNTMPGVDGIKTGYTNASGFNIAVSAVRNNRRLITVVLGAPSTAWRNNNATQLLTTGFEVMARRDRGENITVAQNYFEPPPQGQTMQRSIEQGDNDTEGAKIMLASAASGASASKVKIVEPSKSSLRDGRKDDDKKSSKKPGKWAVQVGAFKSKSDAKEQLTFVNKRFGKIFGDADGSVDKGGGKYQARFTGFNESAAKGACQALKAKRLACMVVRPA
ncbi:D-alanyl-D-alanine carboxypeptidase [Phenylobacterium sp. LH3H17]|uniref:D-alanyl-D-alanine carboxypeptidase n=1 Tax=Phenylobacterium sp. LH3H17 TaxID=2903901 RepID=UPI0020C9FECB|nr:D-alanyl-D-alanine carboxypeptidase [Phenylobacterium sp. LH3H17]UTP41390.1 D-alanyl-D-alanine carboxypeptidase [Phenylobacterium sp. LH3H17]